MKKSRYTDSRIIAILKQSEAGTPVPELCREHGMSGASFYKWLTKRHRNCGFYAVFLISAQCQGL